MYDRRTAEIIAGERSRSGYRIERRGRLERLAQSCRTSGGNRRDELLLARTLALAYRMRRCAICEQFGLCGHREPEVELAVELALRRVTK
jgi:hypothetical protein